MFVALSIVVSDEDCRSPKGTPFISERLAECRVRLQVATGESDHDSTVGCVVGHVISGPVCHLEQISCHVIVNRNWVLVAPYDVTGHGHEDPWCHYFGQQVDLCECVLKVFSHSAVVRFQIFRVELIVDDWIYFNISG